jgi:hypothetical protein
VEGVTGDADLLEVFDALRAAAMRTFWTAGSRRPMRMAMIAITTSSSISVNARLRRKKRTKGMTSPLKKYR